SRSRDAGDDDQRPERQRDVDVLQVVRPGAADDEVRGGGDGGVLHPPTLRAPGMGPKSPIVLSPAGPGRAGSMGPTAPAGALTALAPERRADPGRTASAAPGALRVVAVPHPLQELHRPAQLVEAVHPVLDGDPAGEIDAPEDAEDRVVVVRPPPRLA